MTTENTERPPVVFVTFEGTEYAYTGKAGREIKTGLKSWEFGHHADGLDARVWLVEDGRVLAN